MLNSSITGIAGSEDPTDTAALESLVSSHDWASTPIGPIERWPQSLRIALRILLSSRYAMWLGWGRDLTFFYNDAYRRMTLGVKHPWALGRSAREVWAEIWGDIGPRAESVMRTGVATWDEGLLLFLERSGFREETYHTFSYSPVPDEHGGVGGMLCVVTEETDRVIGERRLRTLRELATDLASAKTEREVGQAVSQRLAANAKDLPFTATYLLDPEGRLARLASSSGVEPGAAAAPEEIDLASSSTAWPVGAVVARGDIVCVDDAAERFGPLPHGAWGEPPSRVALAPIAQQGQERLAGLLVAGLNPYRSFDTSYRGFIELVAGQIAAGIANTRAYEEERRRAEALAELDRAKTAFFSNVSHEFRTPLTLMLGPVEEVLEDPSLAAPHRERLALVHRNGRRLLKLVNNLLDFSRIEAGRVQARYEPTDLARLTADIASVFRAAVERAGMRLVIDCRPLSEPIFVDHEMWEKIVLNLVSNAFKYTFQGEIEVRLREGPSEVELAVRDTGTGIPASEIPRIWSRFHRIEGARGRTHEGTGIGLALVQELVKLHGGRIGVSSEVARGSTFTVAVPRGCSHLPPERIAKDGGSSHPTGAASSAILEEALRWLPDGQDHATESTAAAELDRPATSTSQARPHIVLADDNADMRQYLQRLLAERFEVAPVADGERALEIARSERPDLIITDVMMPRLDGFGLLRALRDDPRTATIPVIMLSARAGEEARVEGLGAGADDYLIKPFSARELMARVTGTLNLSQFRREALRREEELRAETTNVLESIGEGFLALDRDFRITYMNVEAERISGVARGALVGKSHWEAFPATLGSSLETEYRRVMKDRIARKIENHYEPWGRWFEIDAYPAKDGGLAVYFRDVTERKRHTERLQDVANAAVAVSGVLSIEQILQTLADRACRIAGADEAVAAVLEPHDGRMARASVARGNGAAAPKSERSSRSEPDDASLAALVLGTLPWEPSRMAVALTGAEGTRVGALQVVRTAGSEFTMADHAILQQLAQAGSAALANARLYRAAEEARADAEAANRMKDEFLATLSHELRTPLNAIVGWSRILRRGRPDGGMLLEGLETIERNSKMQVQLIEDLLDLSRIISGKLRLDVQNVNLVEVIDSAVATVRPAAEAKEIRLHSVLDPLAGPVTGDPARLQQVVWNLLSNAVKFTPRGGQVQIVLERVNSHVEVSVSDTGMGIPPEFLPHVFERFRQADGSTTRRHGGLGLGLSIVRQLVEMHGGSVRAKSPGEGRGATFSVSLPVSAAHGHDARPRQTPQPDLVPAAASLAGVNVMVVDDENDARDLIHRILSQSRAVVTTAASVAEALTLMERHAFDVLLSDIGMPEQDGYELIRRVRERGLNGRTLPAVALTAFARPEDRRRALLAGFQVHVPKPVDPDELVAVVATLVGRTGAVHA